MAEIHVERKTKKPIWPWVLLIVIVLLVALGVWLFNDASDDQIPDEVEINSVERPAPELATAYDSHTVLLFNS